MSETRENDSQVQPTANQRPSIIDMVCADLMRRKAHGIKKYGTHLQAFNGRSALQDAYEEALDLANYLKQAIEERRETIAQSAAFISVEGRADVSTADAVIPECATIQEHTDFTDETAIYPDSGSGSILALCYVVLGLVGEAGEVAGKLKKIIRDGDSDEKRVALTAEIGDTYWYLGRLSKELKTIPGKILAANMQKLRSRLKRGTLGGNGDNR